MFRESKTKPKYSIRKYSIGAASALIGFMALLPMGKQFRLTRHNRLVT
ncbi:MAG: YSIRK-type signal peptide-containing protein [Streptococcus salivarius]